MKTKADINSGVSKAVKKAKENHTKKVLTKEQKSVQKYVSKISM